MLDASLPSAPPRNFIKPFTLGTWLAYLGTAAAFVGSMALLGRVVWRRGGVGTGPSRIGAFRAYGLLISQSEKKYSNCTLRNEIECYQRTYVHLNSSG